MNILVGKSLISIAYKEAIIKQISDIIFCSIQEALQDDLFFISDVHSGISSE